MIKGLFLYLRSLKSRHIIFIDLILFLVTPTIAFLLRFDGELPFSTNVVHSLILISVLFTAIKMATFQYFGLYKRYWNSAGMSDLTEVIISGSIAVSVQFILFVFLKSYFSSVSVLPLTLPLLDALVSFFFVLLSRFGIRVLEKIDQKYAASDYLKTPVIIIGAGYAGTAFLEEILRNQKLKMFPAGFLDDDDKKQNIKIRGIEVLGRIKELEKVVKETNVAKVIIAMPEATGKLIREINEICERIGIEVSTLPGYEELLSDERRLSSTRKIQIEDLLRRDPVVINTDDVKSFIQNKTVLITGGGGSIGSEICRQVLSFEPSKVVVLGRGENSVFDIEQELLLMVLNRPDQSLKPLIIPKIMDIRNYEGMNKIFRDLRPDIVFHAAAHKHVPLMEFHPDEVMSNNVMGTYNVLKCAEQNGTSNFVFISSDKAVNPTSLMGASKNLAELIVDKFALNSRLNCCSVRFGNVLGSRGSVLNTFKKQIEFGGPITITHPDMRRYFMTISEAVQLVLQASVLSRGGEIFVLDMGQPIRIVDLARDLIKLSGLTEGDDIQIKYTGLRPGEKLYEELYLEEDAYSGTKHNKIFSVRRSGNLNGYNIDEFINALHHSANQKNIDELKSFVKHYIPEYAWDGKAESVA
ncbi:MAG: polysaccharide biosynthesis protein [Ignavibacteriaceae bacterium]|nr:polysaccharide biosynthesis protein [Ignavibacteriaceae bacterium]